MSATETVVDSLPIRAPNRPEVIDVDALDDDGMDVQFAGFQRRPFATDSRQSLAEEGLAYIGFRSSAGRSRRTTSAQFGSSNPTASGSRSISEEVIVVESDEEGGSSSTSSTTRRLPKGNHARLFSPPPPPPERGHTPAVPALPRHLVSQQSLPHSRRRFRRPLPAAPPPVIRPSVHPLPFEARMASLPRLPPRGSPSAAPPPSPPPHHRPSMGLGGALLALNRQNALEEANRRQREVTRNLNLFNLPSFSDIYRRLSSSYRGHPVDMPNTGPGENRWTRLWSWNTGAAGRDLSQLLGDDDFDNPLDFEFDNFGFPADLPRKKAMETAVHWRPEYTHPDKAGPGFTCDFLPADNNSSQSSAASSPTVIVLDDDEPGSSSAGGSSSASALETTLVCARCLDPLILSAPDGAPVEEQKKCRVWALRCGHMLDGKCISHFIAPPPPPLPEPAELSLEQPLESQDKGKGKGKGKARADDEDMALPLGVEPRAERSEAQSTDAPASTPDRKGKRKAVDLLEAEPLKRAALVDPAEESEDTTYRSRLRSHARAAADVPLALDDTPPRVAHVQSRRRGRQAGTRVSTSVTTSPNQPTGRGKGKGKARARGGEQKPVAEAEHQWKCPVAGCGRLHYSVRVEGEWKNDEGRGGIALFL